MIYLDIDGVMLTNADKATDPLHAPAHRLAVLRRVQQYTGAAIVLSSDWRKGDSGLQFLKDHGLWDDNLALLQGAAWHTPLHLGNLDDDLSVRGQYIDAHIRAHDIGRYLIIDDSPVLASQAPGTLMIDPDIGLVDADLQRAIALWDAQA